jgi:hypothetical protein
VNRTRALCALAASAALLTNLSSGLAATRASAPDHPATYGRLVFGMAVADDIEIHSALPDGVDKGQTPAWSPNGTRIAYAGALDEDVDVWVMNADGSGQTQLTTTPSLDIGGAWSPDGTQIGFRSDHDDPDRKVYLMNPDGTDQHPLMSGGTQFVSRWGAAAPAPASAIGDPVVATTNRYGAASDDALWLPNGENSVTKLDRGSLTALVTVPIGEPGGVPNAESLVVGDDGIWVTMAGERAIVLLDATTGAELRRLPIDAAAYAMALDGHDLWVTDFTASQVLRVDVSDGSIAATVDGVQGPTGVSVGADGVWVVANKPGLLVRIDPQTNEAVERIALGERAHNLVLGFDSVWTANGRGESVSRVDPATNRVVAMIPTPGAAYDIEATHEAIWVTVGPDDGPCPDGSAVIRVDPTTNQITETLPFPCAWALIADGEALWVGGSDERGGLLAPVVVAPVAVGTGM